MSSSNNLTWYKNTKTCDPKSALVGLGDLLSFTPSIKIHANRLITLRVNAVHNLLFDCPQTLLTFTPKPYNDYRIIYETYITKVSG